MLLQRATKHFREQLDENRLYVELEVAGFNVQGGAEQVVVSRQDVTLRCRRFSSDFKVVRQIFVDDEFRDLFALLSARGVKVRYIVDAGGNIGAATLRLSRQFPDAKIVCIEPDAANVALAERNIADNAIKAEVLAFGLWRDTRRLYFDRSFRDGAAWSITLTEQPVSANYVESLSLADVMTRCQLPVIDLLKIDIEGGERFIFDGTDRGLEFLDHTRAIAIEIHDEFEIRPVIVDALTRRGFELSTSGEYVVGLNTKLVAPQ